MYVLHLSFIIDTIEELQSQESYIACAIEKINSLMHNEEASRTLGTAQQLKEVLKLWLDMPLSKYVSTKRLYEGLPYGHYEQLYEDLYKQL